MRSAEAKVRQLLSREFKGRFKETRLQIGKNIKGKPAFKKFDAVSNNKRIVAIVKDYSADNIRGNQTRHARVVRDLYYLSLVKAERKFMYLSRDYYEWFKQQRDAAIAPGIEVRVIP